MIYSRYLFLLVCVVAAACRQDSRDLSNAENEKVVKEVEQFFHNYFEAVKSNGLTAEFDYLENSPDFFWVPPGYDQAISYDSVVSVLSASAKSVDVVENVMDSLRIIPLTLRHAAYSAILRSTIKDTSGHVTSLKIIESGVVVKRNNSWKLLNGQSTLINR